MLKECFSRVLTNNMMQQRAVKQVSRSTLFSKVALLVFLFLGLRGYVPAYHQHQVFYQNTDYELNVYRIYGEKPGKTLLILGGIQGNEPGGYLAADLYVEMSLKKGNLIVVPRANFCSILRNVRGVNGDMNRKFDAVDRNDRDGLIIAKLKELIEESDFLLNLHDGSGFYSDTWESTLRNPKRYGQSIIADCETLYSKKHETTFDLGKMSRNVCARVNQEIKNVDHHFHFNNHKTAAIDTMHREQRKSATYFAVTQHEIPAFGIETSKSLPSPQQRVRYQTMVINAFMKEFGIIPEQPRIALPDPSMKYLIVAVNDRPPTVVYNGKSLFVEQDDELEIIHVEANYDRGLTANIIGYGTFNDMKKRITVHKPTDIIVRKDNLECGKISVEFTKAPAATTKKSVVKYLILQVNEDNLALLPGEHQEVQRGDILVIKDLITFPQYDDSIKVNFKGFVGNSFYNDGEDRGYSIDTARDLMRRYSQERKGEIYPILVSKNGIALATFYVDIRTAIKTSLITSANR